MTETTSSSEGQETNDRPYTSLLDCNDKSMNKPTAVERLTSQRLLRAPNGLESPKRRDINIK